MFNLEGAYVLKTFGCKVNYYFRNSDYQLTEQHVGSDEGPTTFQNNSSEYGAIFDLNSDLSQKVVVNFVEDTAITGDEAYMELAESQAMTLGYYLSKDLEPLHLDIRMI